MPFETLTSEREESFALITLNRPPANAISEQLVRDLAAALSSVEHDDGVRAVIITGAGDRIFCAGADLGSAFSGGDMRDFIRFGNGVLRKIERFPKPVIAAMNGHALGGGCEIAMACHLRLLKETARMGQTETNLGIIPGFGGTQRMPRLIGRTKALEFMLLGAQVPAAECLALGLVNRVVPFEELDSTVNAIAARLAAAAPIALQKIKQGLNHGQNSDLASALDFEAVNQNACFHSEDFMEGVKAFIEKRKASFQGK